MKKTPVVTIGFVRKEVYEETLQRLSEADGVLERDIYVYLSAPRSEEEKVKTDAVLEMVRSFKASSLPNITIIQRDKNEGAGKNIAFAISDGLTRSDRVIVIEDDILVSKTFLRYMDAALEYYKEDKRVWCVNGYKSPFIKVPEDYPYGVYFNPRNMAWGWGIWKDRWYDVDFSLQAWPEFKKDPTNVVRLDKAGCDIARMLDAAYNSCIDTWDAHCTFHMVKNSLWAVEPVLSQTKNNGFFQKGAVNCLRPHGIYQKQKYYNAHFDLAPLDQCVAAEAKILPQFRNAVLETRKLKYACRLALRVIKWLIGPQNNVPITYT